MRILLDMNALWTVMSKPHFMPNSEALCHITASPKKCLKYFQNSACFILKYGL